MEPKPRLEEHFEEMSIRFPSGWQIGTSLNGSFEFNLDGEITAIYVQMKKPGEGWGLSEFRPDEGPLYTLIHDTLMSDKALSMQEQIRDWHADAPNREADRQYDARV